MEILLSVTVVCATVMSALVLFLQDVRRSRLEHWQRADELAHRAMPPISEADFAALANRLADVTKRVEELSVKAAFLGGSIQ